MRKRVFPAPRRCRAFLAVARCASRSVILVGRPLPAGYEETNKHYNLKGVCLSSHLSRAGHLSVCSTCLSPRRLAMAKTPGRCLVVEISRPFRRQGTQAAPTTKSSDDCSSARCFFTFATCYRVKSFRLTGQGCSEMGLIQIFRVKY